MNDDEKEPKLHKLKIKEPSHSQITTSIEAFLTASFAQRWLYDALNESQKDESRDTKRREILFAACFAESYIIEWVRNNIFPDDLDGLIQCFTSVTKSGQTKNKGVIKKWKTINELYKDRKIKGRIKFNKDRNEIWKNFCVLIEYRNSLVHAALSIPESSSPPESIKKLPTISDFNRLTAGWATGVVIKLVEQFHKTIGIPPNDWFIEVAKNF